MPLGAFKAALMGTAGVSTGDVVLLASTAADGDGSISFTSGLTSTYGEYIFSFYNMHCSSDGPDYFGFQVNASGQSGYNETATSSFFRAIHAEDDSSAALAYVASQDRAQATSTIPLAQDVGADADQACAGTLHLFNPSSTTYVKHFYSRLNTPIGNNMSYDTFVAGYINVTAAITNITFLFASGNIDTGTIKMWGVK
jgi:hypothetical protein